MKSIKGEIGIFLITLFVITSCSKVTKVYSLPIESDYYVSVNSKLIKIHNEVCVSNIRSSRLRNSLIKFTLNLDTTKILKEYRNLDIRILIEFSDKNNNKAEIGLSRSGKFIFENRVFASDDTLMKLTSMCKKYPCVKLK